MAGLLSPNLGSDPASPRGEPTILTSNGICSADLDHYSKGVKVVSFGQSRCDSSQKGGPTSNGMVLNTSLGGHEGIMTFGNFATLLDEH